MDRRKFLAAALATPVAGVAGSALSAPSAAADTPTQGPWSHDRDVLPGVVVLADNGYDVLAGQRVGVVTNPTGLLPDLRHEVDVMAADDAVDVVAVFGPEHGFRGTAQAGGSEGYYVDERTGLPVYDTYLKSGQPLADIFTASGVDTVVFDIQDAGARFYTYIWTMYDCMEAAVLADKHFVVLDRPNPIGAWTARGPVLDPAFATFVGRKAIAQQHGMTVGELALLFDGEFLPAAVGRSVGVQVVQMRRYARDLTYRETGLDWVLPSPNMPTVDTATVYPGTAMFEGTNLSEGRGTTRPFELVGAPWADEAWAEAVAGEGLSGVAVREAYFTPTFSKHVGKACGGVQLHVSDVRTFDALRTGIAMLVTAKRVYPDFAWRADNWIDKLTGSTTVRTMVDGGAGTDDVVGAWRDDLEAFSRTRDHYLLYHQQRGGGAPA
ncbi:MAG: exo-beta-N-acetylmuramidase NamZ family protein [Actinomycetes bacterium]